MIAQRTNKKYGLDKSNILFIATLIQKNNKAIKLRLQPRLVEFRRDLCRLSL